MIVQTSFGGEGTVPHKKQIEASFLLFNLTIQFTTVLM